MGIFTKVIFGIMMMLVCTTGCVSEDDPKGPLLGVGDRLPEFSIEMNDATVVTTNSLIGYNTAIVFFNTGCSDCREELPVIQALWDRCKEDTGIKIILISREESASEIAAYWEENGFTMPYSAQEGREVYSLFAQSVIPRIFIANREGVITAAYGDQDMPSLELLLKDLVI